MAVMVVYLTLWIICAVGIGLVILGQIALLLTRLRTAGTTRLSSTRVNSG